MLNLTLFSLLLSETLQQIKAISHNDYMTKDLLKGVCDRSIASHVSWHVCSEHG